MHSKSKLLDMEILKRKQNDAWVLVYQEKRVQKATPYALDK